MICVVNFLLTEILLDTWTKEVYCSHTLNIKTLILFSISYGVIPKQKCVDLTSIRVDASGAPSNCTAPPQIKNVKVSLQAFIAGINDI